MGGRPATLTLGALVGRHDRGPAEADVVLQRGGDVVDLTLVGRPAQLPGQLGALRQARRPSGCPLEISPPDGLTTQRPP